MPKPDPTGRRASYADACVRRWIASRPTAEQGATGAARGADAGLCQALERWPTRWRRRRRGSRVGRDRSRAGWHRGHVIDPERTGDPEGTAALHHGQGGCAHLRLDVVKTRAAAAGVDLAAMAERPPIGQDHRIGLAIPTGALREDQSTGWRCRRARAAFIQQEVASQFRRQVGVGEPRVVRTEHQNGALRGDLIKLHVAAGTGHAGEQQEYACPRRRATGRCGPRMRMDERGGPPAGKPDATGHGPDDTGAMFIPNAPVTPRERQRSITARADALIFGLTSSKRAPPPPAWIWPRWVSARPSGRITELVWLSQRVPCGKISPPGGDVAVRAQPSSSRRWPRSSAVKLA